MEPPRETAASSLGLIFVTVGETLIVRRQDAGHVNSIAAEVAGLKTVMVNVFFLGPHGGPWILVDAGLYWSADRIRRAAEERFGPGRRPSAIVLTHGHFDHVGSLRELADGWNVPVYAHPLEAPYLAGRSSYPPPDPMAGRGSMSLISPFYPRGPIDIRHRLKELPGDRSVPHLPGWRWIHTPGHTPGHVSFFRDEDRVLVAGDAFVTTKQESLYSVVTQRVELNGPPAYYTSDWDAARDSVMRLAELRPRVMMCGHGLPMSGDAAAEGLVNLALNFDRVARPKYARYSRVPAISDESGVVSVPRAMASPAARVATAVGGALLIGAIVGMARRSLRNSA
jgi:glyoxylase-like metal-dependent hydrolase (beta-lactamase superfamily II)